MTAPKKTAWIDQEQERLIGSAEADLKSLRVSNQGRPMVSKGHVPVSFTGMTDKSDDEIYELHVIRQQFYSFDNDPTFKGTGLVVWDRTTEDGMNCAGFRVIPVDYPRQRHFVTNSINVRIVGHGLLNKSLLPDTFDLESYFEDCEVEIDGGPSRRPT